MCKMLKEATANECKFLNLYVQNKLTLIDAVECEYCIALDDLTV